MMRRASGARSALPANVGQSPAGGTTGPFRLTITGEIEISGDLVRLVSAMALPSGGPRANVALPRTGRWRSRHVTYEWPANAVREMHGTYLRLHRRYASPFAREVGRSQELSQSALLAGAIDRAMDNETAWLATVRNDGRGRGPRPVDADRRKVAIVMPTAVRSRFEQFFDRLDVTAFDIWGEGFTPTKANVALAAARYGLKTAREWLPLLKV